MKHPLGSEDDADDDDDDGRHSVEEDEDTDVRRETRVQGVLGSRGAAHVRHGVEQVRRATDANGWMDGRTRFDDDDIDIIIIIRERHRGGGGCARTGRTRPSSSSS